MGEEEQRRTGEEEKEETRRQGDKGTKRIGVGIGIAIGIDLIGTIELVKGALRAALAETEALLARTAMSDVIREKKDFFTGFFDAAGHIVSATPIPLLAHVIDPILRQYPAETMRPGDLYWYNDCYASDGGVSHLNDQVDRKSVV